MAQLAEVQLALVEGQRHGAERAEGGRFGGGGVTGEDRAEYRADQQQWRHQGVDQLAPFDRAEFFLRQRRQLLRLEDCHADDVEDIQADQQQAGQQRADEQVADRDGFRREDTHLQLRLLIGAGHHVTQQHQHDRRWNDLPQGAGGRQGAGGDGRVVTAPEHGRQGQQAHGHHGGADDAGAGGEQRADHTHGNRQAAAQGAEQPRHGFEQVFGDPRFLQHHPHEHEQRHRQHGLVVHDAEQAVGQGAEVAAIEGAGEDADTGEQQGHAAEGEGHRIAGHQGRADADEQQDRH
ncbi:hypothetical protein D3C84_478760 [compost metagenome]